MKTHQSLAIACLLLGAAGAAGAVADEVEQAGCQLTLAGERTGNLALAVDPSDDGTMEIYGWNHEIESPRDLASGLPTGKRQLTVEKLMDASSPLLAGVMAARENITSWRLDCWNPSRAGSEEQYYTIELINASVAGVRAEQLNNKYPENMKHEVREHVSFFYDRAIWTSPHGEVSTFPGDDW